MLGKVLCSHCLTQPLHEAVCLSLTLQKRGCKTVPSLKLCTYSFAAYLKTQSVTGYTASMGNGKDLEESVCGLIKGTIPNSSIFSVKVSFIRRQRTPTGYQPVLMWEGPIVLYCIAHTTNQTQHDQKAWRHKQDYSMNVFDGVIMVVTVQITLLWDVTRYSIQTARPTNISEKPATSIFRTKQ